MPLVSKLFPVRRVAVILLFAGLLVTAWMAHYLYGLSTVTWQQQSRLFAVQQTAALETSWAQFSARLEGVGTQLSASSAQGEALGGDDASTLETFRLFSASYPFVRGLVYVGSDGRSLSWPVSRRSAWQVPKLRALPAPASAVPLVGHVDFPSSLPAVRVVPVRGDSLFFDKGSLVIPVILDVSAGSAGRLFAAVDMGAFVQAVLKGDPQMGRFVGLDAAVSSVSGVPLWEQSVFSLSGFVPFSYVAHARYGDASWLLTWRFSEGAMGGKAWAGTLSVALFGFLMTLLFGWTVWRHWHFSKRVEEQVVQRTKELEEAGRRFRLITDNAYDLVTLVSLDGRISYANLAYHRLLGYQPEDLVNTVFADYVHPKDMETYTKAMDAVRAGEDVADCTFRMRHQKGHWIYVEAVAKGVHDGAWLLTQVVLHCRDVTNRKQYADELARSERRFRDFSDSSADWLWEVNNDFTFTYTSPGIAQTLGYAVEELIGRHQFQVLFEPNTPDSTRDLIETRSQRHLTYRDVELWTKSKAGERVCLRISGIPIVNENGEFVGYRGAATNVTASKIDRENMLRMATTDHLTGLLNRARFSEELDRTLNMAKRHKTRGVLLFVDLDQFKSVNDTYGHDAGDALIKAVANVLGEAVRSTDIVARLGGDEFGIIMHNIDVNRARVKVQKIIDELNRLQVDYNGVKLNVTMSVGMITYPRDGEEDVDSASLLMSADLAMYRAKELGRNRLFVDAPELEGQENGSGLALVGKTTVVERKDTLREQLKWVDRLRKALEDGDFEMYYQPIVPAQVRTNPAVEALIRIRDDEGRLGSPVIFIDAAEHFGLIQQLDMAVVKRCFQQQVALRNGGCPVDVSVNLSARSLGDGEALIARIAELVKETGANPEHFTFEVTETAALHNPRAGMELEDVRTFIHELRRHGFRFALDDFGTGFSSFNYIKHLGVNSVKVDGSFVLPIENSHTDRLFVKAIADLSKGLGIYTVAEFVENAAILKILEELGIDNAQGYHLGKPDPDLKGVYERFVGKCMADFR